MTRFPRRPRGFVLMLVVFLIVTLAAIGAYLLTVSTGQIEAATQDEQGARAYQSARAGVEWGAFQLLRNAGGAYASACAGGSASQTLALPGELGGFFARVACQKVGSETEGATTLEVFRLVSTGCNANPCPGAPSPTYVERQLQLTLTR